VGRSIGHGVTTTKGPRRGKPLPSGARMDMSDRVAAPPGERVPDPARMLPALVEEFASVAEPEALLRSVLLRMVVETVSDRGIISWVDGEDMVVADCYDPFGAVVAPGSRWPLDGSQLARLALAAGRPASGDFGVDLAGLTPALRDTYAGLQPMVVAPVAVAGRHVAVLCVSRRRTENFSTRDQALLAVIAQAAAHALNAARLRQERDAARDALSLNAAQAESVETVKTDILRLASHELRTPLTVLNGYLSLIQEGFFGEVPQPLSGIMTILNRRTADMNSLVNDMLVAARLEDVSSTSVGVHTDLREVVRQAFTSVEPRAAGDHSLELVLPADPVIASVDVDRVTLAIRNLVDNAVKYSPHGGEVRCELSSDGATAAIRVSDQGLGIAPEDRGRLFSRFGRILTTANSHIPGIGLGLYFSREVARRHGGDVVLVADGSEVTAFQLTLPLVPAKR
jgi:signal transduction histidine kinase